MTLTLTIIRFIFPFLLLVAFFCLYKKEYKFMKTFMWKMVSLRNSKLFLCQHGYVPSHLHQLVLLYDRPEHSCGSLQSHYSDSYIQKDYG